MVIFLVKMLFCEVLELDYGVDLVEVPLEGGFMDIF